MRYGMPFSAGLGAPDHMVEYLKPALAGDASSVLARFRPRAGYGNAFFGVYLNAACVAQVFAPEGEETQVRCPLPWGAAGSALVVLRLGFQGDPAYECARAARSYEGPESRRATLQFSFRPALIGAVGEDGHTSEWDLTGLRYGQSLAVVAGRLTWGKLDLDLTVAGGVVTVTLALHGRAVAEGSAPAAALPARVALEEQNASGVSGAVTLAPGLVSCSGAALYARWPAAMKIKRGLTNPPTAVVATVPFGGRNAVRWTEPADLDAGTHYYRLTPVSDTGADGDDSAVFSVEIAGAVRPPTGATYAAGDGTGASIQFLSSPTAGAAHRLYVQLPGGPPVNFDDPPAATLSPCGAWCPEANYLAGDGARPAAWNGYWDECLASGRSGAAEPVWPTTPGATVPDGTVTWRCRRYEIPLPPITTYPGVARVILRAFRDGVESRNADPLELEYDAAGRYVPARPNVPGIHTRRLSVTGGLTLAVAGTYSTAGEPGVATELRLFTRRPAGEYDYATPAAAAPLSAAGANGIKTAALGCVLPEPGWHYVRLLAATAEGTLSDPAAAPETLVFVSNANAPAPANVEAWAARG